MCIIGLQLDTHSNMMTDRLTCLLNHEVCLGIFKLINFANLMKIFSRIIKDI